jgi:hypothetical protein
MADLRPDPVFNGVVKHCDAHRLSALRALNLVVEIWVNAANVAAAVAAVIPIKRSVCISKAGSNNGVRGVRSL